MNKHLWPYGTAILSVTPNPPLDNDVAFSLTTLDAFSEFIAIVRRRVDEAKAMLDCRASGLKRRRTWA